MAESASSNQSVYRVRWIGYGLLVFALIDAIALLIPPGFLNPAWEFQAIGQLVERVVVPLLGFALVFFGEFYDRSNIEKIPLKILSWLCLGLTILFVLLVPLGILDTFRLDGQAKQQVDAQVQQQVNQLNQVESQLNRSSPEDIQKLATQLTSVGVQVNPQDPTKLKSDVLNRITQVRQQIQPQAQATRSQQRQGLFKNSIKWNLGALIAAALFFIIWKTTDWARS